MKLGNKVRRLLRRGEFVMGIIVVMWSVNK